MDILGLVDIPVWLLLIILIIVLYTRYISWEFNMFIDMGVDGPKPNLFTGNFHTIMKKGIVACSTEWYHKYDGIYGTFEGKMPVLNIGRPDMIKEITVKNFNSFVNRRDFGSNAIEKPFDKMLTTLKDDHWKFVRHTITPGFSGRKLRNMTPLINVTTDRLLEHLKTTVDKGEDIELKDWFGAFSLEAIAATGFGMQIDSLKNPDDPFITSIKKFFKPSIISLLPTMTIIFLPFLAPVLSYFQPRKGWSKVFVDAIDLTTEHRKENPGEFADLLQQMLDTKKAEEEEVVDDDVAEERKQTKTSWTRKGLTDGEIMSQSLLLFFAGYFTTANLLTSFFHQLAIDPELCEKVLKEVDEQLAGETPNYDNMHTLPYIDMCLSETLRMDSTPRIERTASRDVTVGNYFISMGTTVSIPIAAIHKDPKYWPEPEKFIPERFTAEEKAKRDPFAYLPFGLGPRNCIGMRLAQLEARMAVAAILQKYKPVKCARTEIPIKKSKLRSGPLDNWIGFEARTSVS